jgi:hypothetical protein
MSDDTFRPTKEEQAVIAEQNNKELEQMAAMRESVQEETAPSTPANVPRESPGSQGNVPPMQGNVPPAMKKAMQQQGGAPPQASQIASSSSGGLLQDLLTKVRDTRVFEALTLPSKGRFYDGDDGPVDGVVHIRPMTGEEEQILATPRFVRKGQAIDMIFKSCMQENFQVEKFLTQDRTYLLIYLRGISYSPEYEVEIGCPSCETKFSTVLDLNSLFVDFCPDEYSEDLQSGTLPTSGYSFKYRLSTGKDETELTEYRDRRIKQFGDTATDDSLAYRTASLLDEIEGLKGTAELLTLVKNLPISDVTHLRNTINDPPFGVDTMVGITCASCLHEFEVDLPLESNFFFPKARKTEKTQA